MNFLSSNSLPLFSCKAEELDYNIWKERMRKLTKIQNEFAYEIAESKELSLKLLSWVSERKLYCEICNNKFYSNEGFVNHGCMK